MFHLLGIPQKRGASHWDVIASFSADNTGADGRVTRYD